jgi:hypothetical protein
MKKIKVLKVHSDTPEYYYNVIKSYEVKETSGWIEVSDDEFKTITNPKFFKTKKYNEHYLIVEYLEKEDVLLDVKKLMHQFAKEEEALKIKAAQAKEKAEENLRKAKIAEEKRRKEKEEKQIARARKILEKAGQL